MSLDLHPDLDDRPVLEDVQPEPARDADRDAWGWHPDDDYREGEQ